MREVRRGCPKSGAKGQLLQEGDISPEMEARGHRNSIPGGLPQGSVLRREQAQ